MIVVADTSPILNLARIGRLEIIHSLFPKVLIPVAVFRELTKSRKDLPASVDFGVFVAAAAIDQHRVEALMHDLDAGEAEAIVLAIERGADLLLVDERRGRQLALEAGLKVTGLLGVLVGAKRAGLIDLGKPVLDELVQTARFWVGPELYAEVIVALGED